MILCITEHKEIKARIKRAFIRLILLIKTRIERVSQPSCYC